MPTYGSVACTSQRKRQCGQVDSLPGPLGDRPHARSVPEYLGYTTSPTEPPAVAELRGVEWRDNRLWTQDYGIEIVSVAQTVVDKKIPILLSVVGLQFLTNNIDEVIKSMSIFKKKLTVSCAPCIFLLSRIESLSI